jgi:hypothetical protein
MPCRTEHLHTREHGNGVNGFHTQSSQYGQGKPLEETATLKLFRTNYRCLLILWEIEL